MILTSEVREDDHGMIALATLRVPPAGLKEPPEKMNMGICEDG
ncbi:MAG: hypothetical protein QXX79_04205 [Candidatus Bathyarchaeia archaeon]